MRTTRLARATRAIGASASLDAGRHELPAADLERAACRSSRPVVTSRPLARIATRLQSASASLSTCELKKTVQPRSRSRRMSARTSRRPSGSRPDIGSSKIDELGIVDERLRDADALQHALRELAQLQPALGADADLVEQPARARAALGGAIAEQPGEVLEQLLGRQVVVEVRILGQVADAALDGEIAERPAEQLRAARRREDELHQQLQRGGLAGAVGAEEAEDLARLDLERQAVERPVGPLAPEADRVVLGQLVGGQRVHGQRAAPGMGAGYCDATRFSS